MKLPSHFADLYPFKPQRLKLSNNHVISYLDEGKKEGTPTLFLHGNPTWSFFYRNAILAWKDLGRCIAPDHLGCGLSDKPNDSTFTYQLKNHAENILELVDSLKIKEFNLVVHDWGGAIGMTAFSSTPDRIKKIVLLNTAAFPSTDVPSRILFCRLPVLGEFFVRAMNGFAGPATWMATSKGLHPDVKKGFLYPYRNWKDRVAIWNFVCDIPYETNHVSRSVLESTAQRLKAFNATPKIACWGMKDFCFHGGFLKEWQKYWPNLIAYPFEQAGHYLLEDCFDEVRLKIEPFLFGD
ncbi:MAG: alpha/beta fold hydrolase [Opitutae bacterium]